MAVNNLTPPVISGTPRQGQTLTTTDGTWSWDTNFDLDFAYQWLRCDAAGANCNDIGGATSSSYVLQAADVGSRIRSEVTATEVSPPSGTLYFEADNESGVLIPPWFSAPNGSNGSGSNGSLSIVSSEGGVTPRLGTKMMKAYISTSNRASWSSSWLQASLIQANTDPSDFNQPNDVYFGGSFYIVAGFQYANSNAHVTLVEWHGVGPMSQAPVHLGILGNGGSAGQFFIDLFRAQTGYSPVFQTPFGAMVTGAWMDYVIRTKWSSGSDGRFQLWFKQSDGNPMDSGDIVKDYTGPTWSVTGENIYPIVGIYRGITSLAGTVYHDEVRIGDTLAIVDPGNY